MEVQTPEKREASPNLEALSIMGQDFGTDIPKIEPKVEDKKDQPDPNEIKPDAEVKTDVKVEEKKEESKTEVKTDEKVETKVDDKKYDKAETKVEEPVLELKATDIEGYKAKAEDGTWKATGEIFEVEVPEESPEAFKAAVEAKYLAKIEEARKQSLEQEYAKLKPETVTALKLIEMGVPEEQAFNPTAQHQQFLSMDDETLVRTNLEGLKGWDEDRVNLEMENLSSKPDLLKHEALKLREYLKNDAESILAAREAKLNEYTQIRENAALQQREQHLNQVKDALMTQESFLNAKIAPDAKSEIFQKYTRGEYGDIFKDGKSVAEFLLFKAYGHRILDETKKSSYQKGLDEYAKKMSNIPIKQDGVSKVVVEKVTGNQNTNEGLKAIMTDFG